MKLIWEDIDDNSDRLKVPNGWIVRSYIHGKRSSNISVSIHQIFIEDKFHEWKID